MGRDAASVARGGRSGARCRAITLPGRASVESLPPRCVGVTSATTRGSNRNDDSFPGLTFPAPGSTTIGERTGAAVSCAALASGALGGLRIVGQTELFDTALGDNFTNLVFTCQ